MNKTPYRFLEKYIAFFDALSYLVAIWDAVGGFVFWAIAQLCFSLTYLWLVYSIARSEEKRELENAFASL